MYLRVMLGLCSRLNNSSPQSISKHRITGYVTMSQQERQACPQWHDLVFLHVCVSVDVRFCVKWSLWGIDSSWDVHSGVCVLGCDGHWRSAEGGLATVWQSRLFAEEVTRNPGGNEEDTYTQTHLHKHTCMLHLKSQAETPYWTILAEKHHVIFLIFHSNSWKLLKLLRFIAQMLLFESQVVFYWGINFGFLLFKLQYIK